MRSGASPLLFPKVVKPLNPDARPNALISVIDANFAETIEHAGRGYIFIGDVITGYSFLVDSMHSVKSDEVIAGALRTRDCVTVCDIGAGGFGFEANSNRLFGDRVKSFGITATGFGAEEQPNRKIGYNAEYLSKVFGINQFDYSFSRATFIHFVDPIGAIIEAYKTLKVNGVLLIDRFYIRGCEEFLPCIIPYLQTHGYRVVGTAEEGDVKLISGFIIQKTIDKPELEFPVSYSRLLRDKCRVTYEPTWGLRLAKMHYSADNYFQAGMDTVKDRLITAGFNRNMLNQWTNLLDLFSDPIYKSANMYDKYLLILYIAAKNVGSYNEILYRVKEVAKLDVKFSRVLIRNILNHSNTEYYVQLYSLLKDSEFKQLPLEQRFLLLEFLGVSDTIKFEKINESEKMLVEMGVAFASVGALKIFSASHFNAIQEETDNLVIAEQLAHSQSKFSNSL